MTKRISFADFIIFLLIAVFGVCTILLHQRSADFLGDDVFYADAAQSLLHHGLLGVNGVPETTQPPGLAAILAGLFSIFGYSYAVCVGSMAVFETLGFLVAYEFLRRRVSTLVAATICILLLSSPLYFGWATRMVYPCFAYFFTTMLALLSGDEYDKASTWRSRIVWGTVLTMAVVASLLIATATTALLGAMAAVVVLTVWKERRLARIRLLKFLPVFLVGTAVLGVWMLRKPAPLEWSLPGYPRPYLEQIQVKSGRQPELGLAKWSDIPARVTTNLMAEGDILARLVLRHGLDRTNVAVAIVPFLLIVIGWTYSIIKTRGMELVDWYFAGYQFVYALWPWTTDTRFILPVAPIACFYMWQGISGAIHASRTKPRVVGIIWFPAAVFLTIFGMHRIYSDRSSGNLLLLAKLLVLVWLISAGIAAWMAYTGKSVFSSETSSNVRTWMKQPLSTWRLSPTHLIRYSIYLIVTALVLIGIGSDTRIARENLNAQDFISVGETGTYDFLTTEVEAGIWLRSNTPSDSVVMARHWPTVYHYARRKLVWFAPISDPSVLWEGIVRHGVNYVVVVAHRAPYYLPDDNYCFDRLLGIYPEQFRLVLERANLQIFKVEESVDTGTP
jgi:TM2 domain-containing membrane protein YozV